MTISTEVLRRLFIDEDKTLNEVANELNITVRSLRTHLKKAGIRKRSRADHPQELVDQVIRLFLEENKTADVIAQELGMTRTSVRNLLTYRKVVKDKHQKRRTSLDKSKIDKNNPEFYYFLGWFLTDGSIHGPTVRFNLQERDREVLVALATYFGLDPEKVHPCKYHEAKGHPLALLNLSSIDLVEYLVEEFKVPTSNKTFNVRIDFDFPDEDCFRLFLRGVYEGDGSLSIKKYSAINQHLTASICSASEGFLVDLDQLIEARLGIWSNRRKATMKQKSGKVSTYYELHTTCYQAFRLFSFVYDGFPHLRLNRKFSKFEESVAIYAKKTHKPRSVRGRSPKAA